MADQLQLPWEESTSTLLEVRASWYTTVSQEMRDLVRQDAREAADEAVAPDASPELLAEPPAPPVIASEVPTGGEGQPRTPFGGCGPSGGEG